VSQPTVSKRTQLWWTVHADSWLIGARGPKALLVDFVEMQMPLFDIGFWEFFLDTVGALIGGMNLALLPMPHGWGIDNLWCGAAATYATQVLRQPDRPHCALIPLPIHHRDLRAAPRTEAATAAGERAVSLSCLLGRLAAAQLASASLALGNNSMNNSSSKSTVEGPQPWVVDPKATGYLGGRDGGYNASDQRQRQLRKALLRQASYEVRRTCVTVQQNVHMK